MVSLGYWNCSYTLLTTSHAVIYPMLRACLELILVHVYSASIPPSPAPLPQPPAQPTRRTYIEQPAWHLSSICLNELAAWVCVGVQIT